jgi:hypothetical protein
MAIKYTLSTDPSLRSGSIEEELNFLRASGCLYYGIHGQPTRKIIGDFVYFIRAGQMLARSKITDCRWMDVSDMGGTYTGVQIEKSGWRFEINDMELAEWPIQHKGFKGFRYVTAKELPAFERAFKVRRPKRRT